MRPFTLFAFDLDGTLIDSESINVPDLIEMLNDDYKIPMTEEIWFADGGYQGLAGSALISKLHGDFGVRLDPAEFNPRRHARLPNLFNRRGLAAAPGVQAALQGLADTSRSFCIASNSTQERIRLSLSHTRPAIGGLFTDARIFSAIGDTINPKPAPDVYLLAASTMGHAPAHSLAVEDSVIGATAAIAAGFITFGYTGLARRPEHEAKLLAQAGVTRVFQHWDEFLPLVAQLETSR